VQRPRDLRQLLGGLPLHPQHGRGCHGDPFLHPGLHGGNGSGLAELRDDNRGVPGTVLGSGAFTASTSLSLANVTISPVNLSVGTNYWVVVKGVGTGSPDWGYQSNTAGTNVLKSQDSGGSWGAYYVSTCGATKTPSLEITGTTTNYAPTVTPISKIGTENGTVSFTGTDFTSHFQDTNGDSLARIQLTSLPMRGTLWVSATQPAALNQQIAVGDLGSLRFTPTTDWNGSDSFTWKAQDGALWSSAAANADILVVAVNNPPSFTAGASAVAVWEDSAYSQAWATSISRGPSDESAQTLTFSLTNSNPALFSVQPTIDAATGALKFTPAAKRQRGRSPVLHHPEGQRRHGQRGGGPGHGPRKHHHQHLSVQRRPHFHPVRRCNGGLGQRCLQPRKAGNGHFPGTRG